LEQLRALENGIAIHAAEVTVEGETVSVDTPEDLKRVRRLVAARESGAPASSRR
jgi:CMP-2-keto-3-deoxyoctulosonic acid synthetase